MQICDSFDHNVYNQHFRIYCKVALSPDPHYCPLSGDDDDNLYKLEVFVPQCSFHRMRADVGVGGGLEGVGRFGEGGGRICWF